MLSLIFAVLGLAGAGAAERPALVVADAQSPAKIARATVFTPA